MVAIRFTILVITFQLLVLSALAGQFEYCDDVDQLAEEDERYIDMGFTDSTRIEGLEMSGFLDYPAPQGTGYFLMKQFLDSGSIPAVRKSNKDWVVTIKNKYVRFELSREDLKANRYNFYPNTLGRPFPNLQLLTDLSKIPDDVIGIVYSESRSDSGFRIAGVNSDRAIQNVKRLNGMAIRDIELNMYPGEPIPKNVGDLRLAKKGANISADYSHDGILGENERLLPIWVEQNRVVLKKLKTTHQDLIRPTYRIVAALRNGFVQNEVPFEYHGIPFVASGRYVGTGNLYSPFGDGTFTRSIVTIKNLRNGEEICFASLLPEMIYRYGWYESPTREHHLSPEQIVKVMPFLRKR